MHKTRTAPDSLTACFSGLTVGLLALFAVGAGAPRAPVDRSDEEVFREVAELFLSDPLGDQAAAEMSVVVMLAERMEEVEVVLSPRIMVWTSDEGDLDEHQELLVALIAGNVRSQLDSGVVGNDDSSGLIQVFRVYRALVESDPEPELAGVEELLERHADGELFEWLTSSKD